MRENGEAVLEMGMEFKFGQTVPNMKDFGKIIRPVEMGSLYMQMETFIKVNGPMIKPMESECIIM